MVGYKLCNTVTENGYVSRGVCEMNEAGELIGIREEHVLSIMRTE